MRNICFIFGLLFSLCMKSQNVEFQKPDYEAIKKEIQNKKSTKYYPILLERFHKFDTLMTDDEYKHLYYGYVFQEKYNPYKYFSKEEEVKAIFEQEVPSKDDLKKVIGFSDIAFQEFPFNLMFLEALIYAYEETGAPDLARKVSTSYGNILRTILLSGNGLSCEDAFHVLTVNHEYVLLGAMGIESDAQGLVGNCDLLYLNPEDYTIEGLYFDISKIMQRNRELTKGGALE